MTMKKYVFFALVLLLSSAYALTAAYTVVVAENGNARTFILLEGTGNANIPLPLDANNKIVQGALYLHSSNGIDVNLGSSSKAIVQFDSSLLTERQAGSWSFSLDTADVDSSSITLVLPSNAVVSKTIPTSVSGRVGDTISVTWVNTDTKQVQANYSFEQAVFSDASKQEPQLPVDKQSEPEQETELPILLILAIVSILLLAVIAFFLFHKRNQDGKQKVLKTLSDNERKVMDLLTKNNGGMKRNKLENESEIAKSSLASTLYQLERKNLILVKKDSSIHFVEISDFFNDL